VTTATGKCPRTFDASRGKGTTDPGPGRNLLDTIAFWREVAKGAALDHPSHVVVRVLEGLARAEESQA